MQGYSSAYTTAIDFPSTHILLFVYTRAIMLDRIMRADYVPMEQGNWVNV